MDIGIQMECWMGRLAHKVAVVTRASKGIGAEIPREQAAEGALIVVNWASNHGVADKVAEDVTRGEGKAVTIQGDVAKTVDVVRALSETAR